MKVVKKSNYVLEYTKEELEEGGVLGDARQLYPPHSRARDVEDPPDAFRMSPVDAWLLGLIERDEAEKYHGDVYEYVSDGIMGGGSDG